MLDIIRLYSGFYKDNELEALCRFEMFLEENQVEVHHLAVKEATYITKHVEEHEVAEIIKDKYLNVAATILAENGIFLNDIDGPELDIHVELVIGLYEIQQPDNLDLLFSLLSEEEPAMFIARAVSEFNEYTPFRYYEHLAEVSALLVENIKKLIQDEYDEDNSEDIGMLRTEFQKFMEEELVEGVEVASTTLVLGGQSLPLDYDTALNAISATLADYTRGDNIAREIFALCILAAIPNKARYQKLDEYLFSDAEIHAGESSIRRYFDDLMARFAIVANNPEESGDAT